MMEKEIRKNVPLSGYTTFKIGGMADFFIDVTSLERFREALRYAREASLPFLVLGGGSNVLFSDRGIRGLVIRNGCTGCSFNGSLVSAESGLSLDTLIRESAERGLGGIEFLAGIPGTLGGALYGNAGAYGKSISDVLYTARIVTPGGEEKEVERDYFQFHYRESRIKHVKDVVLSATVRLVEKEKNDILREVETIIAERREKHPSGVGTCGCFFKNVESATPGDRKISAGMLLDEVGAKKLSRGTAQVSSKHANFIINPGGATADDIKELAELLKKKVLERFNIQLEEEVQIISDII